MASQETLKKFNELYENTYNDISKYVVCNCNNIEDVKDIIQNIYLEVFKSLNKNITMNKSYIFGIAKNKVKDYYRFRYKDKIVALFSTKNEEETIKEIPSEIDIEQSTIIKFDTELVWQYLKSKKVVIAKIFYLYYYLGLTMKEIAKSLNLTESNVKHYLYRTLKDLSAYLEKGE